MKIAVNTRLLLKNKMEGIGWFTFETLKRITASHPEHTFYFIFDRSYDPEFIFSENIVPIVMGPPSRHPVMWYIWFNWSLAIILKRIKADVFLSPEGYICLNTNVKTINVMHDIAYEHNPETVPKLVSAYYKYFFPKFAKKAELIGTVSEFSKQDIIKTYKVDPGKIRVLYNGCNPVFKPISEEQKSLTRQKWSDGHRYFVYLGSINPRKNIRNLLIAFDAFKKEFPSEIELILIGKKGFGSNDLEKILETLSCKEDIKFLGRVEDMKELNAIVASSVAMTYVSVFEGFGIPCLEAMQCGTAVITSNTSSMPEVCGDAAVYIDPNSIESIKFGMHKLTTEEGLRDKLIRNGAEQAQKFSWEKTAALLWDIVSEVMSTNH